MVIATTIVTERGPVGVTVRVKIRVAVSSSADWG